MHLIEIERAEPFVDAVAQAFPGKWHALDNIAAVPQVQALVATPPAVRRTALLLLADRVERAEAERRAEQAAYLGNAMRALMRGKLPLTRDDVIRLIDWLGRRDRVLAVRQPVGAILDAAEALADAHGLSAGTKDALRKIRGLAGGFGGKEDEDVHRRIDRMLGRIEFTGVRPGEAWSDAALAFVRGLGGDEQGRWVDLLTHAGDATSAKPSAKWTTAARRLVEAVGTKAFGARVTEWFELVERPRTEPLGQTVVTSQTDLVIVEPNVDTLRGLAWAAANVPADDVCRALARLCETSLKKLQGVGPRLPKLANAAVYALGEMSTPAAVGQLARLKVRVRFGTALKQIEKALDAVAARTGATRDDLLEMGVPSYGLDATGVRRETLGEATAELRVNGSDAELVFANAAGKTLKSVPAAVKANHAEELKDLKAALKDVQQMLPAQRDRLDGLMISGKTWPLADWRERYHDHPLVGTIARRLIWTVGGTPVFFVDGAPTDVEGRVVSTGEGSRVGLWHPVGRPAEEVVAWRARLDALRVVQPFKQAHREVYLLTDAERRTNTYSNRFAAHVIRQHQFNALCGARGWRNKLRLMVDDDYPPASRLLPEYDLRAEFWVEGVGDDYGTDANEAGVYLRLSTDQVRFYRMAAPENAAHASGGGYGSRGLGGPGDPLPLEQIPALVLSEVFRDVDLFVGVASVGNDPTWQDGGPGHRHREYWQTYSFGDLNESAKTRRAVLETLVPRLKIRDRASLVDRFLVVRGNLRTYKIHLGSGNILMEPNDQYLCIVPDQSKRAFADPGLFLPFEGDSTLALILSKAFLLAADDKIADTTITRQIRGK